VTAPFREEAVATREVAATNRDEVVQRILDDAHASTGLSDARRAAALDRSASRTDRAASRADRSQLTEDDAEPPVV
jgi:hypothetical protein